MGAGYTPVYGTLSMKIDEIVDSSRILDKIKQQIHHNDQMKTLDIFIVDNMSSFCTF